MLLIDVCGIDSIARSFCLHELKVLHKPVETVTSFEMMILGATASAMLPVKSARSFIKSISAELRKAHLLGLISDCEAVRYSPPTPKLTLGEFRSILGKFTLRERQLIVVALSSGKPLTECSFLQHKDWRKEANICNWPSELRRFIELIPRHVSSPFIFWETSGFKATAMVGFEERFKQITKASWPVFAALCSNLIPIDASEDAREFATMFVLEASS